MAAASRGHFDERRAAIVVAGAAKDIITFDDGRGDVRRAIGDFVVIPEQATIVGSDGNEAAPDDGDVLLHLASVADDDGGVTGAILAFGSEIRRFGFPDNLASFLFEGCEHGVVSARGANEAIAIDQRGLAVAPAGHHFSAEVFFEVLLPEDLARRGVAGREISVKGDAVDHAVIVGRRAVGFAAADGRFP